MRDPEKDHNFNNHPHIAFKSGLKSTSTTLTYTRNFRVGADMWSGSQVNPERAH